jgi:exonuclease III
MRAGFWNIIGYKQRCTQVRDFICREHLDFVGLQETMMSSLSPTDLRGVDPSGKFAWHSTPALGRSGGMLLGVNEDTFEVFAWASGRFFLRADVLQLDTPSWSFMVVYGPADHRRTTEFLSELGDAVTGCPFPQVVGGDFNIIRGAEDKNNNNICWPRVQVFNDCIANLALREINRGGPKFTWTNRQLNPVRCVLDRVFFTAEWESIFPVCSLWAETIIGSDHSPLILSSGEDLGKRSPHFFFEKGWLERPEFGDLVSGKSRELEASSAPFTTPSTSGRQLWGVCGNF